MYSTSFLDEPTTFGTSGLLYRSNKVMYDRATNTLWSQLTGRPIVGPLVGSDIKLKIFPLVLTTWGEWLTDHPDTTVLSLETGYYSPRQYQREDDSASIYFSYRNREDTMFPVWVRDDRLDTKEEVLGLTVDDVFKAYPLRVIREIRVVNDTVNGVDVVVIASSSSMDARAYRSDGMTFEPTDEDSGAGLPRLLAASDGSRWRVTEDALVDVDDESRTLPSMLANISFWFGWYAFHNDTLLYGE